MQSILLGDISCTFVCNAATQLFVYMHTIEHQCCTSQTFEALDCLTYFAQHLAD